MIEGLSHITFIVRNLDRMARFLKLIFDAEEIYSSSDQIFSIAREKFFLVKDIWIATSKS
jgi:catechol 2,3-dioxygenase-like lactoylglutathione lyase family enzyme